MNELFAELIGKAVLMEPNALRSLGARMAQIAPVINSQAIEAAMAGRERGPSLEIDADGVAHIAVRGMILRTVPRVYQWYGDYFGISFTGAEETRELITMAAEDGRVNRIHLTIDSPGGTVDGIQALADDVFAARGLKTTTAYVDGMMASAALWIGVQAGQIAAGPTSEVGSIGVFTVVEDWSKAADDAGLKVHVISNAPGKGHAFGAPVPDEQLANLQALIDGLTAQFVGAVARGREMSAAKAAELATGAMWLAGEAQKHGLIDAVTADARALTNQSTGATASAEDSTMTKEEQDRLAAAEREAGEAKALAASMKASLDAVTTQRRAEVIAKHADRVSPENREAVVSYGEFCGKDLEKFEAHILTLPVLTRSKAIGDEGAPPPEARRGGAGNMTAEERRLCRIFGFKSWDRVERLGARGTQIMTDGTLVKNDGSFVPPDEFKAYVSGEFEPIASEEFGFIQ